MTKSEIRRTSKAKEQNINKLAREIVAKGRINIAGFDKSGNYNLQCSVADVAGKDLDRMRDAVSDDWRENEEKAEALAKDIEAKTPLIADYEDCRNSELGVTENVYFALGFATAVRLLGK